MNGAFELRYMLASCMYGTLPLSEILPEVGKIGGERADHYLPLSDVKREFEQAFTLTPSTLDTGGPSRYMDVKETGQKVGFITPLSEHFCDSCNRMRLTCTGTLYMCLGQDSAVDLRAAVRGENSDQALDAAIDQALTLKPKGHDFVIEPGNDGPSLMRHMSVTGG